MFSTESLSVLIVDDDPAMLRTTADVLRLRGYSPLTSASGRSALAMASDRQPAIAIVDLQLPDMDGLDVVTNLHASSALTEVIVLTGNASVASAARAVRESIFDYLIKPVSPVDLGDTIERASERWRRRHAEAALQASERRFQALIDRAADPILILDADGQVRYASPATARVLGYDTEELGSPGALESLLREDGEALRDVLWRLARSPSLVVPVELRLHAADGQIHILSGCARNLSDEPLIGGFVLNLSDITQRVELETRLRQAQKMEAIGRLAGGVAHDFNNLLTAIKSYGQLLLDAMEQMDERRNDVREIILASDRGATLTRQLLAFSRQQVLRPKLVDLNQVIAEMEKMLRRLLSGNVELEADLSPGLWPVIVDPGQMEQVIMNLVVNARDAIAERGRIRIDTTNVVLDETAVAREAATPVTPGDYVRLRVSDTGTGMDEATRARIFEPFFTTKDKDKGTGLGLSTVYGIVRQSHGTVWVDSEPGRGTTFEVLLPKATHRATPAGMHAVPSGGERRAAPGASSILLVEDDDAVRLVARRSLERQGYRVTEAPNGPAALAIWQRESARFDLVISDMKMPHLSGLDLAAKLEEIRPGVPVLLMSGYTDQAARAGGELPHGIAFIEKPFSPEELGRRVRELIVGGSSSE